MNNITEPVLTALHLTDIHLIPAYAIPERFRKALREIRLRHPEAAIILNTGDTLGGTGDVKRNRKRYGLWQEIVSAELGGVEVKSILGNHEFDWQPEDPAAPGGVNEVLCALEMPGRYYHFDRAGWRFAAIDGTGLDRGDAEQLSWLEELLSGTPADMPVAILCHQVIWSACAMTIYPGDVMKDHRSMMERLCRFSNVKVILVGHLHLHEICVYNGITHVCGGIVGGNFWKYDERFHETDPGYGLVKFFADGRMEYNYQSLRGIVTDMELKSVPHMPQDWSYLKED